jgi:molecular chaperone GrpE
MDSTSGAEGVSNDKSEDSPENGFGDSAEGGEVHEVEEVEELRRELEDANDRHLRLAAEFDNFRRRSVTQMRESETRAQAQLIARILDSLDDLGRVTRLDPEAASVESVLEGVALVERKLFQLLGEAGLEELDPLGESFDPNLMEAMVRVPADSEEEDDKVEQVFQRGFVFHGQLIRPARVSVRKV